MVIGRAAGLTDTGRRRRQNEDAFVCDPPLFAIADGMGGAQAGELASRLAAAAIEEAAAGVSDEQDVVGVVRAANALIFERSLHDPTVAGMGTTATVALVDERAGVLTLAHVGDSRAYRYRGGGLEQLTTDHSLVAELVRSGRLTEAEAAVHPHRSVITRALGTEADVEVDTHAVDVAPVVITSSSSTILRSVMNCRFFCCDSSGDRRKAPATLRRRSAAVNPVCDAVGRIRHSAWTTGNSSSLARAAD